jgi:DNA-binding protein HU-beta
MNRSDLIEKMADAAEIKKVEAEEALSAFLGAVGSALKKGDKVTLVGFGTFSVGARKARTGRNPRTGATIKIKATKVPRFKAGADLKKIVNK